jgi:hypothetical protein
MRFGVGGILNHSHDDGHCKPLALAASILKAKRKVKVRCVVGSLDEICAAGHDFLVYHVRKLAEAANASVFVFKDAAHAVPF